MRPQSDDGFTVTMLAAPDMPTALLRLAGEIDMTASAVLTKTADCLTALAPAGVVIDLADVDFACSALPNFLVYLRHGLPPRTTMVLCRPARETREVLLLTGMDEIATLRADLPCDGCPPLSTPG